MRATVPVPPNQHQKQIHQTAGMTYNLGATYKLSDDISFFVNHSKGRTAYSVLGSVSGNEADRDDAESVSNDIGMRVKAFDDQLLASLVVFDSARTNLEYANPDYEAGVSDASVPKAFTMVKSKPKVLNLI